MKERTVPSSAKSKAQVYDNYFNGKYQELHHYDNNEIVDVNHPRFFGPVLPKDSEKIKEISKKTILSIKGSAFTILDHGSGDGRNFGEVLKIAKQAKKMGKDVHYIAYDISSGGLDRFKKRLSDYNRFNKDGESFEGLENVSFKEVRKEISDLEHAGYNAGSAKKDNLTVTFIHSDEKDCVDHSKKLVGPLDMVMSVFGPLAHITKEIDRVKNLAVFNELLSENGSIYATLPSKRRFPREQQAFGMLRDMNRAPDEAVEEDVVMYKREDGTVLPYKLFTERSINKEFKKAGFEGVEVGISNAIHQDTLFKYALLAHIDSCFTSMIPGIPADFGSYMCVEASPGKEKGFLKGSATPSTAPATSDSSISSEKMQKYEFAGIDGIIEPKSSGISSASTLSSDVNSDDEVERKKNLAGVSVTVGMLPVKRKCSGSLKGHSPDATKSKSWSHGLNAHEFWTDGATKSNPSQSK